MPYGRGYYVRGLSVEILSVQFYIRLLLMLHVTRHEFKLYVIFTFFLICFANFLSSTLCFNNYIALYNALSNWSPFP